MRGGVGGGITYASNTARPTDFNNHLPAASHGLQITALNYCLQRVNHLRQLVLVLLKEDLKVVVLTATTNVMYHIRIVMVDRGLIYSTWIIPPDILKLWWRNQKTYSDLPVYKRAGFVM